MKVRSLGYWVIVMLLLWSCARTVYVSEPVCGTDDVIVESVAVVSDTVRYEATLKVNVIGNGYTGYYADLNESLRYTNELMDGLVTYDMEVVLWNDPYNTSFDDTHRDSRKLVQYSDWLEVNKINVWVFPPDEYPSMMLGYCIGFNDRMIRDDELCYYEGTDTHPNQIVMSYEALKTGKTLCHELGHYNGLPHCKSDTSNCWMNVMNESQSFCEVAFAPEQIEWMRGFMPLRDCVYREVR